MNASTITETLKLRALVLHALHIDCTCCRAWRVVEQPTAVDVEGQMARVTMAILTGQPYEPWRPTPLLPASPPWTAGREIVLRGGP
jgi:hypothetical protein